MITKLEAFNSAQLKTDLPNIRSGDTVKVHQKIKEKDKQRIQIFEGLVIARKHGKGINSTITVRKVSGGIGIERIFPVHSPSVAKIELVRRGKTRRSKLYFIREARGKKARLKQVVIKESDLATEPKTEVVEKIETAEIAETESQTDTPIKTEVKEVVKAKEEAPVEKNEETKEEKIEEPKEEKK